MFVIPSQYTLKKIRTLVLILAAVMTSYAAYYIVPIAHDES